MNSSLSPLEIREILDWEDADLAKLDSSILGHTEEVILLKLRSMREEIDALNQLLQRRRITANITAANLRSLFSL
mgnify:CR=1 FL=1|jgi:hypothetical protein|tara:strand:- start:134 stop:358 length:225 start_codon:yes stop_codon:yes gene_type:complete